MNSNGKKYLVFSLQDSTFALDLDHVAEVGDLPEVSPIPLAPSCYIGALSFHGNIVAVINLAELLGISTAVPAGKIIVLHQEHVSLAFIVDSVLRIVSESDTTIRPLPDNTSLVSAALSLPEGEASVLNPTTLAYEAEIALFKK
ncbi:MAG: chemotaxis protein CheW [Desulfuromonadaceae bacterium]|nr:chemotaxis protein CheW [Desulfuromonadaceae bacterium]